MDLEGPLHISELNSVIAFLSQLGVGDKEDRVVPTVLTGLLKTKTIALGLLGTQC